MDFIATARRQMVAGELQEGRERLLNSYEGLSSEELLEPGVAGEWSVRDILAHVAAWDRAQTAAFRDMLNGVRPPLMDLDDEGIQTFNEEHYAELLGATLDEVLAELEAAREELLELLRGIDNAALFAPAPGDEHADASIAACVQVSAGHDEEHAEMIEVWRENQPAQPVDGGNDTQ